jgi:hypothetical protein
LAVITFIILQSYELPASSTVIIADGRGQYPETLAGQKFCDFGRLLCDVATGTVRISNDTTQTSFDVDPTGAEKSRVSTPYIFALLMGELLIVVRVLGLRPPHRRRAVRILLRPNPQVPKAADRSQRYSGVQSHRPHCSAKQAYAIAGRPIEIHRSIFGIQYHNGDLPIQCPVCHGQPRHSLRHGGALVLRALVALRSNSLFPVPKLKDILRST